jgi:regulator of sigma E protease
VSTTLAIGLAIAGLMVLVVLHEAGHAIAAKATGMRVEQVSLFFGPKVVRRRRGETEYAIGSIPLGGYAKISGMHPEEDLPPDVVPRAYYNQPVWKRIVVILAGPGVNLAVAFVIFFATAFSDDRPTELVVGQTEAGSPAAHQLQEGDVVLAVDGFRGADAPLGRRARRFSDNTASHHCAPPPRDGCRATTPVRLTIKRDGQVRHLAIRPYYDAELERARLGFTFEAGGLVPVHRSVGEAANESLDQMWTITAETASVFGQLFKAEERKKVSSVVGVVEVTRQAIEIDAEFALRILGLVSLSLALVNLLPFLPLDGGHVFWALVEKLRGRRVPWEVMERASVLGIMLFAMIFLIGLSNDVGRFSDGGFNLR